MAPSEEVAHLLPDTLPDDFSDWDSKTAASPLPDKSSGPQSVRLSGENSRPLSLTAAQGAGVAPGVGRPRGARSSWSDTELSKPQEVPGTLADQVSRSVSYRFESNHRAGEPIKPIAPSVEREESLATAVNTSRSVPSPALAQVREPELAVARERSGDRVLLRPEPRAAAVEVPALPSHSNVISVDERGKASNPSSTPMSDAAFVELFREKSEDVEVQSPGKKKQLAVAAASACVLLLLLLLILVLHHGTGRRASLVALSAQPGAPVDNNGTAADRPKPQAGMPLASAKSRSKSAEPAENEQVSPDQQATAAETDSTSEPSNVQSAMMNEQLTAPARITQKMTTAAPVGTAPPPVNLGGYALGANSPNGSVFNAAGQPVVKMLPTGPIAIAPGVANRMLIERKAPSYPLIAKNAGIAGTVVLQVIISRAGTVQSLHVVSGPKMLRQSAIDAVQTWRYKPLLLNNQPVEMETTVSVAFTLAG